MRRCPWAGWAAGGAARGWGCVGWGCRRQRMLPLQLSRVALRVSDVLETTCCVSRMAAGRDNAVADWVEANLGGWGPGGVKSSRLSVPDAFEEAPERVGGGSKVVHGVEARTPGRVGGPFFLSFATCFWVFGWAGLGGRTGCCRVGSSFKPPMTEQQELDLAGASWGHGGHGGHAWHGVPPAPPHLACAQPACHLHSTPQAPRSPRNRSTGGPAGPPPTASPCRMAARWAGGGAHRICCLGGSGGWIGRGPVRRLRRPSPTRLSDDWSVEERWGAEPPTCHCPQLFVKTARGRDGAAMFEGEAVGLRAMHGAWNGTGAAAGGPGSAGPHCTPART